MSADDRQNQLVIALALGKLSEAELLRQFPAAPEDRHSLGPRMLRAALANRDPDAVESGIILGYHFGLGRDYVELLERLVGEDWHQKHEDIVLALGKLRSPTSVEPLYAAAQSLHAYLIDDGFELHSKGIHALSDIGTPEAVRRLEELFHKLEDPSLRAKIVRRFEALASAGRSEETRAAARGALSRTGTAASGEKA